MLFLPKTSNVVDPTTSKALVRAIARHTTVTVCGRLGCFFFLSGLGFCCSLKKTSPARLRPNGGGLYGQVSAQTCQVGTKTGLPPGQTTCKTRLKR